MYYEINVSKLVKRSGVVERYEHYFATAERSITSTKELKVIYDHFVELFPEPEFNLTVTNYEKIGHFIDVKTI